MTFAAADIATLGDKAIVASLANGAPLAVPAAPFMYNGAAAYAGLAAAGGQQRQQRHRQDKPRRRRARQHRSATSPNAPAEPFAWDLQLRNTMTKKYSADMTYTAGPPGPPSAR